MAARFNRRFLVAAAAPLVIGVGTMGVIAVPSLAAASPSARPASHSSHHKPTIKSVQKRLAHLAVRNSQLVEKFDQARIEVGKRSHAAALARVTASRAAANAGRASQAFTQIVQAQYESGGIGGSSGALLTSPNSNSYLDSLSTMDLMSSHEAQVVKDVKVTRAIAAKAYAHANDLLRTAKLDRDRLANEKSAVRKQIHSYKAQLAKLNAAQLRSYNRTVNPSVSPAHFHPTATSAAAQRAVNFAIAQIGKPYVFGASGPSTYDCSGLTMMAWRAGGVSLPHSALEQYNYGTHVSRSQLQPGDLIFFYNPIGHVTIYVGDGMMVSAPETGEDVSLVPLAQFNNVYAGATHLG